MKFRILNKDGDKVLTVAPGEVREKFEQQQAKGRVCTNPKTKERIETADKIPNTVEELMFGKLERRGEHGY